MRNGTAGTKAGSVHGTNGLSNGAMSRNGSYSHTSTSRQSDTFSAKKSFTEEQQVTVLNESVTVTRRKFLAEFGDVEESYIDDITIEDFLEYIERQRLTHMPHRGSHWDKVLKWAEFFALQISGYAAAVGPFVPNSKTAAQLIWIASESLLDLGPENAQALETTFGVFYRLGLSISMLLQDGVLLSANSHVRTEVGQAFKSLLVLVREVSLYYKSKSRTSIGQTSFDFNGVFGGQISAFHQRKNHILDAMWEYSLGDEATMEVKNLRKWLGPHDSGLQKLLKAGHSAPGDRDEYTCEWFQSHLLSFSRSQNDTLAIHGPAGCGKSVLWDWIVERLQRSLGKRAYVTLSCTIEADIPSEATLVAVIKGLLYQLLENNVGHKKFYKDLVKAYYVSMGNDHEELQKHMWNCFESGLKRFQETSHVMLIVDGLDEIHGGTKTANGLCQKLASLAVKYPGVQLITMSRDSSLNFAVGKTQRFEITADHTHEDLRIVIDHCLEDYKYFQNRTEHAREHLVDQLLHAAKGNFLWAFLTTVLLKRETSEDGFTKAIKAAKDAPMSLEDTIAKLLGTVDLAKGDTNLLVSLVLNAVRPLAPAELRCLLQVDLAKRYSVERKTDMAQDIRVALDPLIVVRNGFVRFYHSIVRSYMLKVQGEGKKLRNAHTASTEMAKRLLAYCNFNLSKTMDVNFDPISKSEAEKMFSTHPLLEYAVRTWTFHFRSSTMGHNIDALQLDDEFRAIFPSTSQLSMLEWICWGYITSRAEAIKIMDLALRVRIATFSEQHTAVLQTLIAYGNVLRETTQTTAAADCFYRASIIGQQLLPKFHTIIAACTTTFLVITEAISISTRTELATRREKMLIYTIDMYKYQHGKTHDLVIQSYKKLAQLYVDIHEKHNAETIWRELREITIARFGKGSEEELRISENLTIVLKEKGDTKTDVIGYEQGIFDIVTELEVWDTRRIKLTIDLAKSYEARGEVIMAEELYIFLWRRLTEECHHPHQHHGVEIHIQLLDVVIKYVEFLRHHHRHEEASNVLICIWTEYEEYDFESEVIFLRLRTVGELMRSVSLLSVAVTVFKKCMSWFKSRNIHEHATSCEVMVSETIEEVARSTTTTTTSTSVSTRTTSETIIKEAFESTLSRNTVSTEMISICKGLISRYMKLEQWSLAIEVTRKSLQVIWRSVLTSSGTIALPQDFATDAIEIAVSLTICYRRSHHFYQAEEIYVRIYRACRNSCRVDDQRLIKAHMDLIAFYEEHRCWKKIFDTYRELLKEYRRYLGASHHLTIQTLYKLGYLCADHGYGDAQEYFEEIVTELNRGSNVCHPDALDAMIFLCRYNYEAGLWQKLQVVCKTLWETWKGHHHSQNKFTVDFVEKLYTRYRYVLEHHVHSEYSVLRELTVEYRNTCVKVYGAAAAITIRSKIELAQVCMRNEKHYHEAITIFEEVITQTKTSTTTIVSTTTITTIKQQLTEAYTTVCSHDSVSITTVERAIAVVSERYEYLRLTYGWAHVETLASLREVLLLWKKSKKQDSTIVVSRLLLEATVQIVNKERHSQRLYDSGRTIGSIFMACGMSNLALELVQEIRSQIITGSASHDNKHGVKVDKSAGAMSFVFLVTLEQAIRGPLATSYSQVMADYLTESVLYQSYHHCLNSSAISIITHTARLRAFLLSHQRHSQRETLENHSYDIFTKQWAINARSREVALLFYVSLLVQIGDTIRDVQIGNIACQASISEVRRLLESGQVQKAYEVAECAFGFIDQKRSYHHLQNVPLGFKLSGLLTGRDYDHSNIPSIDSKLHEAMLELSRKIIRGVLKACQESKIDFVRLKLKEINDLVELLGDQQNYADLEWILELLWKSREVQKTWKADTIIAIGRRFVQARYLNASKERRSEAIRLCEDICYNMRRTWGSLHPKALEMNNLLSELYTNMGHTREAQGVHEDILRLVVEGDDGDDRTLDTTDSDTALHQIALLKQSFLRLGGWDKSRDVYDTLITELKKMPEYSSIKEWKSLSPPSEWNPKETPSKTLGKFVAPTHWQFIGAREAEEEERSSVASPKQASSSPRSPHHNKHRPGMGVKRATSNWGLGLVHKFMHGDHGHANGSASPKSNGVRSVGRKASTVDDGEDGYESAKSS